MAMERMARRIGYQPLILTTQLMGEAKEIGKIIGSLAKEIDRTGHPIPRPACVMLGGEPTVSIHSLGHSSGKGGRAQELVLAAAIEIAGRSNLWIAGLGTDGHDGSTDAAGAVADGHLMKRAQGKGLDPFLLLENHDSYSFFHSAGGHIRTGPTGTNVNDVYLIVAP